MRRMYSIKENKDFVRVYRRKHTSVDRIIVMYITMNKLTHCRLGLSVSKKIGNAVVRNKIKRQLREIFRLHMDNLKPSYDIVIVARKRSVNATYQEIEKSFLKHCRQLNIVGHKEEVT